LKLLGINIGLEKDITSMKIFKCRLV